MRRSIWLLSTVVLTLGFVGTTSAQTVGNDTAAVGGVVRKFNEALVRGDSMAALALLADDAVVLESGGIEDRSEYRSHHLGADIEYSRALPPKPGPLRIRVVGDVAWVASTSTVDGESNGRAVHSTTAALMVLARTGEGWRIRAIHWSSRRRTTPS